MLWIAKLTLVGDSRILFSPMIVCLDGKIAGSRIDHYNESMTTENRKPKTENRCLTIIGGGLAGSEAAWQAARRGVRVRLDEMKPQKFSPAHQSPFLGELVAATL